MYVMSTDHYCNLQNPNKFLNCPGGIWAKTPLDVFPGKNLPKLTPNLPQFPRKLQTSTAKFDARETQKSLLLPCWCRARRRRHSGCRAAAESSVVWPRARSQAAPPGVAQAPPTHPPQPPSFRFPLKGKWNSAGGGVSPAPPLGEEKRCTAPTWEPGRPSES